MKKILLSLGFILTAVLYSTAQNVSINDTIAPIKTKEIGAKENNSKMTDSLQLRLHNPKKATCWAIIPGGGQIYNKKYWKLPLVYAGLGATGYLIYHFGHSARLYGYELKARYNADIAMLNVDYANYSDENLIGMREYNLRNMEISIAACALVYILSIVDATVDAHLHYFDISDDLAIGIKPKIQEPIPNITGATPSASLVLKFK